MKKFTEQVAAKYLSIEFSLFHFIISMMIYQYGKNGNQQVEGKQQSDHWISLQETGKYSEDSTGRRFALYCCFMG